MAANAIASRSVRDPVRSDACEAAERRRIDRSSTIRANAISLASSDKPSSARAVSSAVSREEDLCSCHEASSPRPLSAFCQSNHQPSGPPVLGSEISRSSWMRAAKSRATASWILKGAGSSLRAPSCVAAALRLTWLTTPLALSIDSAYGLLGLTQILQRLTSVAGVSAGIESVDAPPGLVMPYTTSMPDLPTTPAPSTSLST